MATVFLLFTSSIAFGQNIRKKQPIAARVTTHPVVAKVSDSRLAPLGPNEKAVSYHAPFDSGDCSICHQSNDVKNPGPITTAGNEMCMNCHDDFRQTLARKYPHQPSQKNCLSCHNPHNSKQPKLLLQDSLTLCLGCHQQIRQATLNSAVKHDALTQGGKCMNCHNPHGANVEHLLVQMPMQLCMDCHGKDGVPDHAGKKMTNMKSLLAANKNHHGPVAGEDCSSCHKTHGGDNFRLLTNAYPALFYTGWDAKNYALCFGCHDEKAFTSAETTELTQFRDGSRNLHYVHTNKSEFGRSCRACHEVHASTQDHQIRDAVPYGPKGWMLKVNFTKTETGGACAKTCHATKTYNNSRKTAEAPAAPAATPTASAAPTAPAVTQ